ncbi:MAG TPA: DNA polymerase IV [Clostridiales bacterium]|nr:DNA polymerase IV [Clostridiales bacterium]
MSELRILHVDLDAFFASVEQRDRPELRGRPVVVGGDLTSRRGVVAAASYEARRHGIHSAMPLTRARRLCPAAVFLPVDFPRYREASRRFLEILRRETQVVETVSLDEAFLDLGAQVADPPAVARRIKRSIAQELSLTASVGVAANKLLAKLASEHDKPDGLTIVPSEQARDFLDPQPIRHLPGIGPAAEAYLKDRGIFRIGDLARIDPSVLRPGLGSRAEELVRLARGIDGRRVIPFQPARSLSEETTFAADLHDRGRMVECVQAFAAQLEQRLVAAGLKARTVTVKVRFADFRTVTRSFTRDPAIAFARQLAVRGEQLLLAAVSADGRPVRLIGLGVSGLVSRDHPEQLVFPFEVGAGGDPFGPRSIRR